MNKQSTKLYLYIKNTIQLFLILFISYRFSQVPHYYFGDQSNYLGTLNNINLIWQNLTSNLDSLIIYLSEPGFTVINLILNKLFFHNNPTGQLSLYTFTITFAIFWFTLKVIKNKFIAASILLFTLFLDINTYGIFFGTLRQSIGFIVLLGIILYTDQSNKKIIITLLFISLIHISYILILFAYILEIKFTNRKFISKKYKYIYILITLFIIEIVGFQLLKISGIRSYSTPRTVSGLYVIPWVLIFFMLNYNYYRLKDRLTRQENLLFSLSLIFLAVYISSYFILPHPYRYLRYTSLIILITIFIRPTKPSLLSYIIILSLSLYILPGTQPGDLSDGYKIIDIIKSITGQY